jgi:hypothetical protein
MILAAQTRCMFFIAYAITHTATRRIVRGALSSDPIARQDGRHS